MWVWDLQDHPHSAIHPWTQRALGCTQLRWATVMQWGFTAGHGGRDRRSLEGTLFDPRVFCLCEGSHSRKDEATHRQCFCPAKPIRAPAQVFIKGWLLRLPLPASLKIPDSRRKAGIEHKSQFAWCRHSEPLLPVNCRLGHTLSTKFPDTSLRPAVLTLRYTDDKPFKFIEWCASIPSQHFSYECLHVFLQIL